ncbi:MAG: heparan-alpha-glucosaminide N-acetyltransferase domain-containing protein [Aeromicrobium sp.]|uniref:heparan-alpha-glucosaminide N-acetyltransferase domain-containing protein n=1 Tax=Aeromicrobium sp. TaxID=1871063 RepID=UPI0039E496AD
MSGTRRARSRLGRPHTPGARLVAIDLARGVALLGMMLAHLGPDWWGDEPPPVSEWLASGRAAPLFALLAGLSVGLMTRFSPDGVGRPGALLRRAVALLVIGLALAALPDLRVLVILPCYALLIAAAVPLRRLPTRWLAVLAGAWCALSPFALFGLRQVVAEPRSAVIQPSWAGGLAELPVDVLLWGGYPAVVWFGYVLVGLTLSRLDLADPVVGRKLALGGAAVTVVALWAAAVALYLGVFEDRLGPPRFSQLFWTWTAYDPLDPVTLWAAGQHTSTPLNVIGAAGSATMAVGLCVWVCGSARLRRLTVPIQAAGAMTLTLYCLHVLMVWNNREHDLSLTGGDYTEWWAHVVLLVLFAWAWRHTFARGPLESAVRWVSRP